MARHNDHTPPKAAEPQAVRAATTTVTVRGTDGREAYRFEAGPEGVRIRDARLTWTPAMVTLEALREAVDLLTKD